MVRAVIGLWLAQAGPTSNESAPRVGLQQREVSQAVPCAHQPVPKALEGPKASRKKRQQEEPPPRAELEQLKRDSSTPVVPRFRFEAANWWTFSSGKIHATEFQSAAGGGETLIGTELDLNSDFDARAGAAQLGSILFEISEDDRVAARYLYEISRWTNALGRDVRFNETFYDAGTPMRSEIHHYRFELFYERDVLSFGGGSVELAIRAGTSQDRLDLKLRGAGKKKGEDFGDEIIPLLGLGLTVHPLPWLDASLDFDHGFDLVPLNRFSENTQWTTAALRVEITVASNLKVGLGYVFGHVHTEFHGMEADRTSNSADNVFDLRQQGPLLSLELRF